ncbi:hypothetical protein V1517DRAFT_340340 [Lipomyces orientalis]|uniref:Uncharacterized protein n=1 Tax=Lipomyces orientalis TaxID=1233043 RepID=A0ACC3TJ47_9ASCO
MKLKTIPFEETCKISRDYATTAIQTLDALRHKHGPLRFLYMSGYFAPRSPAEVPKVLQDHGLINHGLLRVWRAETLILEYGEQSKGAVQSCAVKPKLIDAPGREKREVRGLPHIDLPDIAAALLDQVVNGFEKDTLSNADMILDRRLWLGSRELDGSRPAWLVRTWTLVFSL